MEKLSDATQGNPRTKMTPGSSFLHSVELLKNYLQQPQPELEEVMAEAFGKNPWFYPDFVMKALNAIAEEFLDAEKCVTWLKYYPEKSHKAKTIAIIMAGNIPLVGFHDLFCVLASGNHAMVKLSDKDSVLPAFVIKKWIELSPDLADRIHIREKLDSFDAVIATGSNNSARYFEYYFKSYPRLLRHNRTGVAVLTGEESFEDLKKLGEDIFLYYGLGCRNVSKIYVPDGYNFELLHQVTQTWGYLSDHNKYRNNLDYNLAIYQINSIPYISWDYLILKEDEAIVSRIGCLHYSFYHDQDNLLKTLKEKRDVIQCIVSKEPLDKWDHIEPGKTQYPSLSQYADGVDTMQFLLSL
jgi:hypothetical protein